jgi:hypothetical protein
MRAALAAASAAVTVSLVLPPPDPTPSPAPVLSPDRGGETKSDPVWESRVVANVVAGDDTSAFEPQSVRV